MRKRRSAQIDDKILIFNGREVLKLCLVFTYVNYYMWNRIIGKYIFTKLATIFLINKITVNWLNASIHSNFLMYGSFENEPN
jgi:hypothetical protein